MNIPNTNFGFRPMLFAVCLSLCVIALCSSNSFAGGKPPAVESAADEYDPNVGPEFDLTDPDRIANGESTFNQACASFCHGKNPLLFVGRTGLDQVYVYETIRDGGQGQSPMPSWGTTFTPEEIWELVAYLKSLGDW